MINKVILLGNVGADPEVRTFEEGTKVARLRVATTERTYNPKTQERGEKTQWHTVVMWRGLAAVAEQYIRKGSKIYVEGKINYTEWTDGSGQKRYGVEVIADEMKMLDSRREGGSTQPVAPQQYTQTSQPAPTQSFGSAQPQQYSQPAAAAPAPAYTPDDEDLPF